MMLDVLLRVVGLHYQTEKVTYLNMVIFLFLIGILSITIIYLQMT